MSIKVLLTQCLEGISNRSSDLTQILIDQSPVGCLIGLEEEEDAKEQSILAISTLIPIDSSKEIFKEILNHICQFFKDDATSIDQIRNTLFTQKNGLFINERFVNAPPQLIPTLHEQLKEDIKDYKTDNPEDTRFDFDNIFYLTKFERI